MRGVDHHDLLERLADLDCIDHQLQVTERRLRDECALSRSLKRAVDTLVAAHGPTALDLPGVTEALAEWKAVAEEGWT